MKTDFATYIDSHINPVEPLMKKRGKAAKDAFNLKQKKVIVPPIKDQMVFRDIVTQADKSKAELRKSIDAIDKVIKSLINENL